METGTKVALGLSGVAVVGVALVAYRQISREPPAIPENLVSKLDMLREDVTRHENGISAINQTVQTRLAAMDRKVDREIDGALQRLQQLAAQFENLSRKMAVSEGAA